jgi:hypothetical protein
VINNINIVFGKPVKGKKRKKNENATKDSLFKKQSILFRYLTYCREFEIGHAVNTMMLQRVSLNVPSIYC